MEDIRLFPAGTHFFRKDGKIFADGGRIWPESLDEATRHHIIRYKLARNLAYGRVLDAACGVGYGSFILAREHQVVGVDINAPAIAWAKRYFPGPTYIVGDITKNPWEGKFDTIVSIETIEHMQDPLTALKAFRGSCRGMLIASVPNEELYPFKAENFENDEYPHYRHYTPDEFSELLESAGFEVAEKMCQKDKINCNVYPGTNGRFLIFRCELKPQTGANDS